MAIALIYVFQEKLLYVPRLPGVPDYDERLVPERYGFDAEDVWLTAADGTKLHAWLLVLRGWTREMKRTRPVVMFFQENAGNMSHRLPFLRLVATQLQVPIFALSYRGYGQSMGVPKQPGIMQDAQAALDHVSSRDDVASSKVVLFGRSLGGAVAIHLAAANQGKVAGLVVENTFLSVEDMAAQVLPPLGVVIGTGKPLNWLVTNKWKNVEELPRITDVPLLLMASRHDEMVPFAQMLRLQSAARSRVVQWVEFPDSQHMDAYMTNQELYWPALRDFLGSHVAMGRGRRLGTRDEREDGGDEGRAES